MLFNAIDDSDKNKQNDKKIKCQNDILILFQFD